MNSQISFLVVSTLVEPLSNCHHLKPTNSLKVLLYTPSVAGWFGSVGDAGGDAQGAYDANHAALQLLLLVSLYNSDVVKRDSVY